MHPAENRSFHFVRHLVQGLHADRRIYCRVEFDPVECREVAMQQAHARQALGFAAPGGEREHGLRGIDAGDRAMIEKLRVAAIDLGLDLRRADTQIEQMRRTARGE